MKNLDQYQLLYNDLWLHKSVSDQRFTNNDKLSTQNVHEALVTKQPIPNIIDAAIAKSVSMPVKPNPPTSTKEIIAHYSKADKQVEDITVKSIITDEQPLINNWDTLVSNITNCTKCELCHGRQNVVIERGSRTANWMFIGEGPGENEDLQGKPFVGAAGDLLQKMLLAMNLDSLNDVYICNVVKCRPPYNRNPEDDEINACKNYLLSQIELVKPKIIVALGRFAFHALLDTKLAMTKFRGKVNYFNHIPLIVTYHPAYLLRNPVAKKDAWLDLQLALKVFDGL